MSLEAEQIISISMKKIANSRNQRGGLKLHKSLMVTNVIINAKNHASRLHFEQISSGLNKNNLGFTIYTQEDDSEIEDEDDIYSNVILPNTSNHLNLLNNSFKKRKSLDNDDPLETKSKKVKTNNFVLKNDSIDTFSTEASTLLNSFEMCHLSHKTSSELPLTTEETKYTTLNSVQLSDNIEEEYEDEESFENRSCSTQIREALETLTRPILTLAV